MLTHTHERDGVKTVVPFSKADYLTKIQDLESEITPRRTREALLNEEGLQWIFDKDLEIQNIRNLITKLE